ncbi:MAG: peptidyl-prolyl cis-trans isomerase [Sulfuricurvum sp.]|uniref:peptidylprolyl isomerase n=1 Tax=Sulfuricurvum sp. TaxID=2025608 RepID=UPI002606EF94|nr:peptidyl-prolyl cis-trans isomerase [Sulfuricurvum sp.]MDD5159931.1 peptidyl-prolyl cis-trans isomerase [Sulfuricurvum sp.]
MSKRFIGSIATAFLLTSSLQAHVIAPDEIKKFAAQALQIDFDKAPEDVKQKISTEYTQRIKLAETLVGKLKNDPEFIQISETLALDLWSKRIAEATKPTDEELQKAYKEAKDLNMAASYKIRHIVVMQETLADVIIKQLKEKSGDERTQLFNTLASTNSIDQNTKQKGGYVGWVDSSALPVTVRTALKDKEAGSFTKLSTGKDIWDIILLDEIKPEHSATFDEAKSYLENMIRQQTVENEAKKILATLDVKPSVTKKASKKSK